MKLQQLRFLAAVVQSDLNITAAAARLCTTQPAVSKQIRLLEEELGFSIFVRSGRTLSKVTPLGERVIQSALRILREAQSIKSLSADLRNGHQGTLSIGTTHTQARYVLPGVISEFRDRFPRVQFHLHQGTSEQIAEMALAGRIDLAIATGADALFEQFVRLPCYRWYRRIIVPVDHPLAREEKPTLRKLAEYPIVTYVFSFSGASSLQEIFAAEGLRPNIALTARDADVIKTYVRLGLGVGIIASMAYDPLQDEGLVSIDASHLFPPHVTWIGFARSMLLRRYMYDFLSLFASHLTRERVDAAVITRSQSEIDAIFKDIELPWR